MEYRARRFDSIYELSNFLNENKIKREQIIGIYRENMYHDQGYFDLLYTWSESKPWSESKEQQYMGKCADCIWYKDQSNAIDGSVGKCECKNSPYNGETVNSVRNGCVNFKKMSFNRSEDQK